MFRFVLMKMITVNECSGSFMLYDNNCRCMFRFGSFLILISCVFLLADRLQKRRLIEISMRFARGHEDISCVKGRTEVAVTRCGREEGVVVPTFGSIQESSNDRKSLVFISLVYTVAYLFNFT